MATVGQREQPQASLLTSPFAAANPAGEPPVVASPFAAANPARDQPTMASPFAAANPARDLPAMGSPVMAASPARDHPNHGASPPAQLGEEIVFQNPVFANQSPRGRASLAYSPASQSPASKRTSSGPRTESQRISPRLAPHESLVRTANGDLWSRGPNIKATETQGSWEGNWAINTRAGFSVAAQPSEGAFYANPLTTGALFTEQQSALLGSRKENLLTSRTIYDMDGRYHLLSSSRSLQPQAADGNQVAHRCWDGRHRQRKQAMEDSALEAEIHLENMAHHKSMGKHGGLMHAFSREGLNTGPLPETKQKERSRHRSKPRLTKAQLDFMAMQPQKTSQQPAKKPAGIFHRQMHSSGDRGRGGRSSHRTDAYGINRLDARNDRAMDTHARIIAWIEQGEWYWREHCAALYSPVNATVDVDRPGGRGGKLSAHSQSMASRKKQTRHGSFSLLCCDNPCVK